MKQISVCMFFMLILAMLLMSCATIKTDADSGNIAQTSDTAERQETDEHKSQLEQAASDYILSVGLFEFESGDTVFVDRFIPYILFRDMTDEKGEIRPPYSEYSQGMACTCPREKLSERIESIFGVKVDDSVSEYFTDDKESYTLTPTARDGFLPDVRCLSYAAKGENTVAEFEVKYPKSVNGAYDQNNSVEYYSSTDRFELTLNVTSDGIRFLSCKLSDTSKGISVKDDDVVVGEGENYKIVLNDTDNKYICCLYKDGGSYMGRIDTYEVLPTVSVLGESLLKIAAAETDDGYTVYRFCDTKTGRITTNNAILLDNSEKTAVYLEWDFRTVTVRDIFDKSVLCRTIDTFEKPLADVDNPIVSAKLSEDEKQVVITYLTGDAAQETAETFDLK